MVSPRKSASSLNLEQDEYGSNGAVNRLTPSNRKSCDSLYSAPSSRASASVVYRRKVPAQFGARQPALIPATTEVQQRVISARRLRFKNIQNQLGLAQHKITELSNELRVLRTLHKRQNAALAKYESTNAELPRLLHSHAEELRVWQTKYRTLQGAHKELEQKLKQKEAIILALADENKYYSQLNKDKNLDDRHRLADKLQQMDIRLQEKDNQMKIAERRSHLEIKNLKQQLHNEQKKTKDTLQKLEKAKLEISTYQKLEELNITEKLSSISMKQAHTKVESKQNTKKTTKDRPYAGAIMSTSKTPSPALETADGEDGDDDDGVQTSLRSLKSTNSSLNVDFSTRTVRKMSLSMGKKTIKETSTPQMTDNVSEIVEDGPDQKIKSVSNQKKSIRKTMKMMLNIPCFDGGADDDTLLGGEDDTNVVLGEGNDLDGIDYNYANDYDENDDAREDADIYEENRTANHELNRDFQTNHDALNSRENGYYANDNVEDLSSRSKESIMNIRKQISDDYKDREAFLDNFCRQATNTSIRKKEGLTLNKTSSSGIVEGTSKRKDKLLAALKAIDDDQWSGNQA